MKKFVTLAATACLVAATASFAAATAAAASVSPASPTWHVLAKATSSGSNAFADVAVTVGNLPAPIAVAPFQKRMRLVVTSTPHGRLSLWWGLDCETSGGGSSVSGEAHGSTPLTFVLPKLPTHDPEYCNVTAYAPVLVGGFSSITIKLEGLRTTTSTSTSTSVPSSTSSTTTITVPGSIGTAQRIVQGMERFDPADQININDVAVVNEPITTWKGSIVTERSMAEFIWNTQSVADMVGFVYVYTTHADALLMAETFVQWSLPDRVPFPVAGNAVLNASVDSLNMVNVFGRAVGKPVVTVKASVVS